MLIGQLLTEWLNHHGQAVWPPSISVGKPLDGGPACGANGGTIGFHAKSAEAVQAFHDAGVAAGGASIEDPPGERKGSFGTLILAYLRDPTGNKICAMHRPG